MAVIRLARDSDWPRLAQMRALLWPEASAEEHLKEMADFQSTLPVATLVAELDGNAVAFLEVGLRSHADGCDTAQAVGFIEGWFVEEAFRSRGVGGELMHAAEEWARTQGCTEVASDTWIDSEGSQRAHEALGFEVVDRCVHYRKALP
jgi:aminoglycoside 6'-N-acetyltransferase I